MIAAVILASAAAATISQPSMPDPGSAGRPSIRRSLTTAEMFELARQAEARGDSGLSERVLRTLMADPDRDIRSEARFRLGQYHVRRGNWRAAADLWTALLDDQPGATRVRLELAHALAQLGDEAGARRQIRRAQASGLPREIAQLVERFDAALRSQRRLGLSLEVALAPDSNINRAGDKRLVDAGGLPLELDEDAVAQSGVGVSVSGQAFVRPRLGRDLNLLATLSGNSTFYGESRFNLIEIGGGLGPEWLIGPARLRLRGSASTTWFGGNTYSASYGVEANGIAPVGRTSQAEILLGAQRFDYRLNDGLDGWIYSGTARLEHALTPRMSGRLQVGVTRAATRDPAYANWSWTAQALLARDLGRVTVYALGSIGGTKGDAPFALPPLTRRDRLRRLEAGLVVRSVSWHGLSPILRVSRTLNHSNIFFYDHARSRLEVGLTRDF